MLTVPTVCRFKRKVLGAGDNECLEGGPKTGWSLTTSDISSGSKQQTRLVGRRENLDCLMVVDAGVCFYRRLLAERILHPKPCIGKPPTHSRP